MSIFFIVYKRRFRKFSLKKNAKQVFVAAPWCNMSEANAIWQHVFNLHITNTLNGRILSLNCKKETKNRSILSAQLVISWKQTQPDYLHKIVLNLTSIQRLNNWKLEIECILTTVHFSSTQPHRTFRYPRLIFLFFFHLSKSLNYYHLRSLFSVKFPHFRSFLSSSTHSNFKNS